MVAQLPCKEEDGFDSQRVHMKVCTGCKTAKPLEEFYKRKESKDGRRSRCRPCDVSYTRSWKQRNEAYKAREKETMYARRAAHRERYREYMEGKSCIDCGFSDLRALVHDHVRGVKFKGVTQMVSAGFAWDRILEEIDKCEIRCANCHAIVTAKRGGYWYSDLGGG